MKIFISDLKSKFLQYRLYFKNSFLYLFSAFFTAAIQIAINPFMAKNLSPQDYAIIGYYNSFNLLILPVLNFSLIAYYLRKYFKIPDERKQIVSDTILIALLAYGLVALILICVIFFCYHKYSQVTLPFYPFVLLAFTPIYINNFFIFYQINCRLKREAYKFFKITLTNSVMATGIAIFLVVVLKGGATGKLSAALIASILIGGYCFKKSFGTVQFDWSVIQEAFKFGWPLSLSLMLVYFMTGMDRALLERFNDSHTLGFYNVAFQMAGYLTFFFTAIAQTFEPDIYKAIAENNQKKLVKISSGIIILNAMPNILFIIFAFPIIKILTYNRYTSCYPFAQIMALKNITFSLYAISFSILAGYGYTKSVLAVRIVGCICCIFMYNYLISTYQFYGAAWGQVFSFLIVAILSFLVLWSKK